MDVRELSETVLSVLRWPAVPGLVVAPASLEVIRARAPRLVTRGDTLDFRTLVPERGGLFDYRVFGPGTVIDTPLVDDDAPWKVRNTTFARLELARPLVHPLVLEHALADVAARAKVPDVVAAHWREDAGVRRRLVAGLEAVAEADGGWWNLVLRELPVLPPDLRPLQRLADDRWQTSSLNDLYRRVIERNARLAKLPAGSPDADGAEMMLHQSLLALFDNERTAEPVMDSHQQPLGSLRWLAGEDHGCATSLRAFVAAGADPAAPVVARVHRIEAVALALGFTIAR